MYIQCHVVVILALHKYTVFAGADIDMKDVTGRCAFEYITDHEEWIQSGLFSSEVISKLKC